MVRQGGEIERVQGVDEGGERRMSWRTTRDKVGGQRKRVGRKNEEEEGRRR